MNVNLRDGVSTIAGVDGGFWGSLTGSAASVSMRSMVSGQIVCSISISDDMMENYVLDGWDW